MANHRSIEPEVVNAFANALREAREARRLTQETFAELCGLSAETLQRYERSNYSGHSVTTVKRILSGFAQAAHESHTHLGLPLTSAEQAPFDFMVRALGSHRTAIEGVYATQQDAYAALSTYLRERLDDGGPCVRSAVLIQTSGTSAFHLLTTLIDCLRTEGAADCEPPVTMYTADSRVLASLGSELQEKRIEALQDDLPNALQDRLAYVSVRAYRTPPSISAVHIELLDDAPILLLGFVEYTQNLTGGDYLDLSARNRAAFVARGATPNYEKLYPTFGSALTNLKVVARPQGTAWYGEDMPPATVAYFRLRSLLRDEFSVENVAFLGLWAGIDLGSLSNLLEATCAYYQTDGHHDEEMVAYLKLVLGLAYRELASETDSTTGYERAEHTLNESLEFWTRKPDASLARAYCYDRLGTVAHLLNKYDDAAQYYEDAQDWARRARGGKNEMAANLVNAWAQLNRAMLSIDRGELDASREYLESSLLAFESASEHGALLTCVAATACYAHARGEHETALQLIGSLSGEGARRLSATYWHRWVVKALKSSRRALGNHHLAKDAELRGESWLLTDSLREVHRLIDEPILAPIGV